MCQYSASFIYFFACLLEEQEKINQLTKYEYRGVSVDAKNFQIIEINRRIDQHIPKTFKVTIYNTILKPILMYGIDAWALTSIKKSRLQTLEIKALRLIRGVTKKDRLRSTKIREDLGQEALLESIEAGKLKWFSHIIKMDKERYP